MWVIGLVCVLNLVVLAVAVLQGLRLARERPLRRRWDVPVEIVVPCEGEEPALPGALAALRALHWDAPLRWRVVGPAEAGEPPPGVNRKAWFVDAAVRTATAPVVVVVDARARLATPHLAALVGALELHASATATTTPLHGTLGPLLAVLARGHLHGSTGLVPLAWTTGAPPPVPGAVVAWRRRELQALGGYGAVATSVTEDLALGELAHAAGRSTTVVDVGVPLDLGALSVREAWARQVRWIRAAVAHAPARAWAYPLLLASPPLLLVGAAEAPGLVLAVLAARVAFAAWSGAAKPLWTLAADAWLLAAWVVAGLSTVVSWRGRQYTLGRGARTDVAPPPLPPVLLPLLGIGAAIGAVLALRGVRFPGADGVFLTIEAALVLGVAWRHGGRVLGVPGDVARLLVVGLLGFGVEVVGVASAVVFGRYTYGEGLGPTLWDVPWAMAPAWIVCVAAADALGRGRWPWTVAWLVALDLVMDPVAARLGLWTWPNGGAWHGVPIHNFVGWFVVGLPLCWLARGRGRPEHAEIGWINVAWFGVLALAWGYVGAVAVALGMVVLAARPAGWAAAWRGLRGENDASIPEARSGEKGVRVHTQ